MENTATVTSFSDPIAIGSALNSQFGAENECVIQEVLKGKVLRARCVKDSQTGTWSWTLLVSGVRVSGGSARNEIGAQAGMAFILDLCTGKADHDAGLMDGDPAKVADRLAAIYQRELASLSEQDLKRARWTNWKRRCLTALHVSRQ